MKSGSIYIWNPSWLSAGDSDRRAPGPFLFIAIKQHPYPRLSGWLLYDVNEGFLFYAGELFLKRFRNGDGSYKRFEETT